MPTGNCRYPDHHASPSAWPPAGLIAAIAAGALIVAEWHTLVIVAAVAVVLVLVLAAVVMLWHSAHSEPYDSDHDSGQAPASQLPAGHRGQRVTSAVQVQARTAADRTEALRVLTAQVDRLSAQLAAQQAAPVLTAPAQHLHLHGLGPDAIAALAGQLGNGQAVPLAIEPDRD